MNVNLVTVDLEHVLIWKEALLAVVQKVTYKDMENNNVANVKSLDLNLETNSSHAKIQMNVNLVTVDLGAVQTMKEVSIALVLVDSTRAKDINSVKRVKVDLYQVNLKLLIWEWWQNRGKKLEIFVQIMETEIILYQFQIQ